MPTVSTRLPLHILFIFIDGVGLGDAAAEKNPLASLALPAFRALGRSQPWTRSFTPFSAEDHLFHAIDACLNVDGLPQSGTGQASLFTGINCSAIAGRHFGPYPHSTSKPVIARHNIFSQVANCFPYHPAPGAFANAYPPVFFKHARTRNRWTVTTLCCMESGLAVRTGEDLNAGLAVTADLTGTGWREKLNLPINVIDEYQAAQRLTALSEMHPFTLFEYYLTDKAGHSQDPGQASNILQSLDRLFAGLLDAIDPERTLLLLTSDHGNLEDLSTKSHTRNPVPLIAIGKGAGNFSQTQSLTGVAPAIVETLRAFNST